MLAVTLSEGTSESHSVQGQGFSRGLREVFNLWVSQTERLKLLKGVLLTLMHSTIRQNLKQMLFPFGFR